MAVRSQTFVASMKRSLAPMALMIAFASDAKGGQPTVAWDTSGLSVSTYKRIDALNLERRAVLRLVEDGFAVVGLSAAPRVTIRLKDSADGVLIEVSGELGTRRHSLMLDGASLGEVHLEIMQRCVTMAKAVLGANPDKTPTPSPESAPPPQARFSTDVSLTGGGMWRSKNIDPVLSAHVGMSFTHLLGVHLKGDFVPSSGIQVTVQDWHLVLGPRAQFHLSPSWKVELAILGGVRIHVANVATFLEGSGTRLDVMGALLLRVRRELKWGLRIEAALCGGVSPRINHRLGNTLLWERSPASLEASVGIGWSHSHFESLSH